MVGAYLRGAELRIATQPELRGLDHQGDQRVVVPGGSVIGAGVARFSVQSGLTTRRTCPLAAREYQECRMNGSALSNSAAGTQAEQSRLPGVSTIHRDVDRPRRKGRAQRERIPFDAGRPSHPASLPMASFERVG